MADKSGYEIRSEILNLAHQIVSVNAHMSYDASKQVTKDGDNYVETKEWTPYNVEQVLEVAEKLNSFIQKK